MPTEPAISDVVHAIQLAVAPVFLLSGVAMLLNVFTHRLARIIDRGRVLEGEFQAMPSGETAELRAELGVLSRRARVVNVAITLGTMSALLICVMIALLFLGALWAIDARAAVAVIFIACTVSLVGALITFLREIFLAVGSLHFGPPRA